MTSWTAEAVNRRLGELTTELQQVVDLLKTARPAATKARRAASRAKSNAFLKQDGPMEIRKNKANVDPEYDHLEDEALVAEALVEALTDELWLLKDRLQAGRMMGQNIRDESRAIGLTQHT